MVYRIYTDDQYKETRAKEIASEIVDYLSGGLDKTFFINTYNEVKAKIQRKRIERKREQKILLASEEGAKIKDKKRLKKAEKKKEKHKVQVAKRKMNK